MAKKNTPPTAENAARRMTAQEYAEYRGVSKQIVNRHIAKGRLPKKDGEGLIDVAAADAAWSTNVRSNPSNVKAAAKRQPDGPLEAQPHGGAIQRGKAPQDVTPSPNALRLAVGEKAEDFEVAPTPVDVQVAEGLVKIRQRLTDAREREGELIERAPVEAKVFELARKMRNACEAWPHRYDAIIAAELGVPAHKVRVCLERHIKSLLADLAGLDERSVLPRRNRH